MARKTIVELIDDIDGSKADETVSFGLDGVEYELDLTEENAARLRGELATWIEKSRRVGGRRSRGGRASGSASSGDTARVRRWARENGFTVSDRGRISAEVQRAYDEAHGR